MKICFIYTDTNGLHHTNDIVSTKNLYNYARLIALHYIVGEYENNIFTETKQISSILKPKTINFDKTAMKIHNITMEKAIQDGINNDIIISQLKNDIKDVDIIVSHNLLFHIKAIQVECFRTAINIDFTKFILIDTISFIHTFNFPKLTELIKKLKIKDSNTMQLYQIKNVFFKLYNDYIIKL